MKLWITLLFCWIIPNAFADDTLIIPRRCLDDLATYWQHDFTFERAYAQFQQLQYGEIVTIGSCRIGVLHPDNPEPDPLDIAIPVALTQAVDKWYFSLHRTETIALIKQFLTGVCVDIPINRQEQIVSVCQE